ncbi:MAG: hypothetical protein ACRCZB_05120 [Bacteroidales bacterium]
MDDLKTIFFIGGTSGSGKSTRVYCLIRFLEELGYKPTNYLICNGKAVGREYLNSFFVIGKEYLKDGEKTWQGLDVFSDVVGGGNGSEGIYKFLHDIAKTQNILVDSACLLKTHRSRPKSLNDTDINIRSYSRFYFYETIEEYKSRIGIRNKSREITERSEMWLSNKVFKSHVKRYREEEPFVQNIDRHEMHIGDPNEPVWTVGEAVLLRIGKESLVEDFKTFAENFLSKPKTIVQSVDLF